MAKKFEQYRMKDRQTLLSESYFNPIWQNIDNRLNSLESIGKDWKAEVDKLNRRGLERIDRAIKPAIESVEDLADLGFLHAPIDPNAEVVWQPGDQEVLLDVITTQARARVEHFQPSPFVVLTRESTPDDYLVARRKAFNVQRDDTETITSAVLSLDVLRVEGAPESGQAGDVFVYASPGAMEAMAGFVDDAQAARDAAQSARDTAESAATTATSVRDDASVSASEAADSESKAHDWAQEAEDAEVEAGEFSAFHWAQKAKDGNTGTVLVSSNDANQEPLATKLKSGTAITLTIENDGGDERLRIDGAPGVNVEGTGTEIVSGASAINFGAGLTASDDGDGSATVTPERAVTKSSAYTASDGEIIHADTSGGPWTLTAPGSPGQGARIGVRDKAGSFGTNNLTLDGNGKNILGAATFTFDANDWPADFEFNADRNEWIFGGRA